MTARRISRVCSGTTRSLFENESTFNVFCTTDFRARARASQCSTGTYIVVVFFFIVRALSEVDNYSGIGSFLYKFSFFFPRAIIS